MEVSMRQQIKEIRIKQESVDRMEKECMEKQVMMQKQLDDERKSLVEEKERLGLLLLELEEKQQNMVSKSNLPR